MSLNGMATVLAHRGDTAGAVRLLRNSLNDAQAPPSRRGQTWALIGKYELGRGNMKASRSAYSRAVELRPEDHTVRTGWALAAVLSGKASESLGHLEAALELAPNDPAALYVYSMALGELGRPEEALELARRCIAVAPEYALAYEQAGRICMKTGKWSEAVGYLEELVRLLPNDPRAAELLGRAREK